MKEHDELTKRVDALAQMYRTLKNNISGLRFLDWQKTINEKVKRLSNQVGMVKAINEEVEERFFTHGSCLNDLERKVAIMNHDISLLKKGKENVMNENVIVGRELPNDDFTLLKKDDIVLACIISSEKSYSGPNGTFVVEVDYAGDDLVLYLNEEGDTSGMPTKWVNPKGRWAPIR